MPVGNSSIRSIARCVFPVLVGPRRAAMVGADMTEKERPWPQESQPYRLGELDGADEPSPSWRRITKSTLRFLAFPSFVLFEATGCSCPKPRGFKRRGAIPLLTK